MSPEARANGQGASEAQRELGWRWPVQQALYELLGTDELHAGDFTTWTDAIVLTEKVAEVLRAEEYVVMTKVAFDALVASATMTEAR